MDYTQSRITGRKGNHNMPRASPCSNLYLNSYFNLTTSRQGNIQNLNKNLLNGMYDFLLAHQINGQFVSADDLDDEDSILEVLDREEYNRISTGFFYLHQLLNPYMRCTFGTPEQRILYIEKSKNQRFSALQRVFIGIWSGENKLVSRSSVVDDILAILEDKRDD